MIYSIKGEGEQHGQLRKQGEKNQMCFPNLENRHNGIVPKRAKIARIIPVFKSGDKNDMSNYRPI